MNPPLGPQPRQRRHRVRYHARLNAETHAKLEALACTCHQKRSAILRFVMQWGLTHSTGWTIDRSPVVAAPPVPVLLEPELLQQVQDATVARGVSMAAWLREALRRVTPDNFPDSWRVGELGPRSHDSPYYGQRFMLRLDQTTATTLQHLVEQFGRPRAEIIRQFMAQAMPEQFPSSWQLAMEDPCAPRAWRNSRCLTPRTMP